MKSEIIRNTKIAMAILLPFTLLSFLNAEVPQSLEDVFIMEPIGEYTTRPNVSGYNPNPSQLYIHMGSFLVNYFYKYHQSIDYSIMYDNGKDDHWHIQIIPTKKEGYMKQGILIYVIKYQPTYYYFTDNSIITNGNTWQIRNKIDKPYLLLLGQLFKGKRSVNIFWQSENVIVHISSRSVSPFNKAIVEAYFGKYPPTWSLTENELKPENVIRNEIRFALNTITEELDPKRSSGSPADKFEPMLYQCEFESYVRSLIIDDETGCPITLELNNTVRKIKWRAFRKKAFGKELQLDNLNWKSLYNYNYREDSPTDAIAQKLGVELNEIPMEYYNSYDQWPSIKELRKNKTIDNPEPK